LTDHDQYEEELMMHQSRIYFYLHTHNIHRHTHWGLTTRKHRQWNYMAIHYWTTHTYRMGQ